MDQIDQLVSLEEDNFQIQLQVTDPIVKDGVQKYILYTVRGVDRKGSFEVLRRFSDFVSIRTALVSRWPGIYVPPVPSKKAIGNLDAKFIEERRLFLELFCLNLTKIKYLWYSEEWEIFIRPQNPDIEKSINLLPKQNYAELITKYENTFKELSGKEISPELIEKIRQFQGFLKKVLPMLDNFKIMALNIMEHNDKHKEQVLLLIDYLMPEYEKNCLTEYVVNPEGRLLFQQSNQLQSYSSFKEGLQKKQLWELYQLVRTESKEIEAFIEAVSAKEKYENMKLSKDKEKRDLEEDYKSLEQGKTSLKSIFGKSKEESMQKCQLSIESTQKEIESLQFFTDIITIILGYIEIDAFKAEKEQKYYKMLQSISQVEIENAKSTQEFWGEMLQNPNIQEV